MGKEKLPELLERVEAAEGPDRVADFELHILLVEDATWPTRDMPGRITNPDSRMSDYLATYREVINSDDQDFDFPRYTASVDAALALVERVLPGWGCSVNTSGMATVHELPPISGEVFSFPEHQESPNLTPVLAILHCLLRALIAEDGE